MSYVCCGQSQELPAGTEHWLLLALKNEYLTDSLLNWERRKILVIEFRWKVGKESDHLKEE
jgi:hypothetical protein